MSPWIKPARSGLVFGWRQETYTLQLMSSPQHWGDLILP